jgi:two-component system, cell cycle sensor histidine kinase and response regulator CckA
VTELTENSATKTVLVIDDEVPFCLLAQGMLESQGYRAIVSTDAAEGLKMVQERWRKIDAVLVDLSMRPMNGREILIQLRQLSPNTPVVMMSGSAEEDITVANELGAFPGFLQKPFTSRALARAIRFASAAP